MDVYAEVVYPKALQVPPLLGHYVVATALSILHVPNTPREDKKCHYLWYIIRTMKTREAKSMVSRSTSDSKSLNPYQEQYCAVLQEERGSASSLFCAAPWNMAQGSSGSSPHAAGGGGIIRQVYLSLHLNQRDLSVFTVSQLSWKLMIFAPLLAFCFRQACSVVLLVCKCHLGSCSRSIPENFTFAQVCLE